jgi:diadenosine tetraphosphate (Ap4A) HIT family hydrolase
MSVFDPERCPFCAISPDRIAAANSLAVVIPDAYPVPAGHSLVIPRRHVADIFDKRRPSGSDLIHPGAHRPDPSSRRV